MIIRHKFNAKRTECDGIKFASKKEARRYEDLNRLKSHGEVVFFTRQIPFDLPGRTKYVCDFQIFWQDGHVTFEDVKGFKTPMYKLKKKQVESLYPIKIIEV